MSTMRAPWFLLWEGPLNYYAAEYCSQTFLPLQMTLQIPSAVSSVWAPSFRVRETRCRDLTQLFTNFLLAQLFVVCRETQDCEVPRASWVTCTKQPFSRMYSCCCCFCVLLSDGIVLSGCKGLMSTTQILAVSLRLRLLHIVTRSL